MFNPIMLFIKIILNYISRNYEFQVDNFAKETYNKNHLISALKKITKKSLHNLTPHPLFVFIHYSHPTLNQRIKNILR